MNCLTIKIAGNARMFHMMSRHQVRPSDSWGMFFLILNVGWNGKQCLYQCWQSDTEEEHQIATSGKHVVDDGGCGRKGRSSDQDTSAAQAPHWTLSTDFHALEQIP
jgi:hypothetical protein